MKNSLAAKVTGSYASGADILPEVAPPASRKSEFIAFLQGFPIRGIPNPPRI
jgi:hypothetical protein